MDLVGEEGLLDVLGLELVLELLFAGLKGVECFCEGGVVRRKLGQKVCCKGVVLGTCCGIELALNGVGGGEKTVVSCLLSILRILYFVG